MTTRAEIISEARSWLGTPFQLQQRMKGVAVDCAGLVICVARALGIVAADFDVKGYSRRPDGRLLELCDKHLIRVGQNEMQPGDVVVASVDADPQHMGILGDHRHGGLSIIHAASHADGTGSVVETRLAFSRSLVFVAAYAFPGVA
jgi:cell wall-associated NlpC family hydrolase